MLTNGDASKGLLRIIQWGDKETCLSKSGKFTCASDHCFECKTNYAIVTAARVGHWLRQSFANRALW
jgi:hypothetical protein